MNQEHLDDEIDLIALLRTIWQERRTIITVTTLGAVVGLIIAFTTPNEYSVTARLMPEYSTESQGGASSLFRQFGGLAGLGASSYSSSSNALRVELYPEIVQTLPFQKQLMEHPFRMSGVDSAITLFTYFTREEKTGFGSLMMEWTIGLPSKVISLFRSKEVLASEHESYLSDSIFRMDAKQLSVARNLGQRVKASLDNKSGTITISVNLPDPVLAANVGQYVIEQLTDYLVQYRTKKLQRDLTFTEERLLEARSRYERAGIDLSVFSESQQGTATARARRGEQFLQSEYELAFGVYNTLTEQLEQQKLKLQEETPMFKILQPIYMPESPTSPKKMQILIVSILIGGLVSLFVVLLNRSNFRMVFE